MNPERLDELIDKYAFGTISPEELQELLDWYRSAEIGAVEWPAEALEEEDHLQRRMLLRLQAQIREAPEISLAAATPAVPVAPVVPTKPMALPRGRVFRLRAWQVAACLLILFSTIWIVHQNQGLTGRPAWVEVRNPTGKIRATRLPDSSEVWLNAASTIRYSPDLGKGHDASREVFLEGEGYFDVAEDPAHSFVVHAGALTTTVLGTRFDIKSFPGEKQASVSVISGKVRVGDSARVLDVLTAARQLRVDTRTGNATTVTIDTSQVLGWRQGRLQYSAQTMEEIAASLGRWYNIRFVFANPAIGRCRYYLNFENTISLQQLLATLKETTDLNFQDDVARHTVTISGNGCN
ncbi:MAG TPA: FecR domain-containing protein [Puia sp.]|uniref:FecR family protein n=1 Tax=Puia sp. TaxID=2045100 RepID=UPI002BA5FD80|nr:FecR domain-containing protein [Puia sp.]HVU93706.1 FecR domain-containing protein [Puia sp.]